MDDRLSLAVKVIVRERTDHRLAPISNCLSLLYGISFLSLFVSARARES